MDVPSFLDMLARQDFYDGQLAHVEQLPARAPRYAEPAEPLAQPLRELLARRGTQRLWTHQVAALEHARAGRDLVVVSGTASGKTLAYHLPVLETCLADEEARALYLYPTKALAQDQLRGLLDLTGMHDEVADAIVPGVYDGDTPTAERRRIQAEANLVLSNPDMLHGSILPYHPRWARFFAELRYVVLDEVHQYRGILGANVACVLRRLARVCQHYGGCPQFLATSATIANPGELTSRLIGRNVAVIDDDGAPRGRKFFALWNPTPVGKERLARSSATDDAARLLSAAVADGAQALAFTRTRQASELVHRYTRENLAERQPGQPLDVRAYRGGYLPHERRQIEQDLFAGKLRGVATTNALELGIDVGSLDVVLLVGYPGTIASTWQQAGRAGRRQADSLAVLIAGNDPIDQYLLRHPSYFFAQTPEHAAVDPENPYVLCNHLRVAAFEMPLDEKDVARFGSLALDIAQALTGDHQLNLVGERYHYAGEPNPASRMNLRHMSDNTFSIVLSRSGEQPLARSPDARVPRPPRPGLSQVPPQHEVLAQVDAISAPELVYPQAVYLHDGEPYLVRHLDFEAKLAYVERHEMDYYTQAVLESQVHIKAERERRDALPAAMLAYGEVDVSWQTVAFKKIKFGTRENIGLGPVDLPAQTLPTTALWLVPDDALRRQMKLEGVRASEGLTGLRNLAIVALPLVAMCDTRDVSGVVDSHNLGQSAMILYDRYPGGLGYCERGYANIDLLLELCRQMVADCPCHDGCPSCVGLPNQRPAIHADPDLSSGYPMPDKRATQILIELLLAEEGRPRERALARM